MTVLAVPAKLAQNESVQSWFFLSGWANLSFPKAEVTARGSRHPNLIIVYASEAHTGTQLDPKTSMFELDFKLA